MYIHKGKVYPSFRVWAWLEGCKLLALILLCLTALASPFLVTGKLQRAVEQLQFTLVTAHFISAPTVNQKGLYVQEAEADAVAAGIPPQLFVRQIAMESGFNPSAYSSAGAVGIAQFMPGTAAGLGIDPYDPTSALQGAAMLMARYYHTYGDYAKALAAYNGGSGTVAYCAAHFGPLWETCEPKETQAYITAIMS